MPVLSPADLWQESGRWDKYETGLMFRLQDRHQRDYCLGPTHEEVVVDIFRKNVKSYRDLPMNLYQIQTKFRDEFRPRFGLMRGREFMMKDAYSFDVDKERALAAYDVMIAAYTRIFDRFGLAWRKVAADSGDIGGDYSHEFHVLADTGEDDLLFDADGDYAVNVEKYDTQTAPKAKDQLQQAKGIEVGHCFHLSDIYSAPLNATITDESGTSKPVLMGCYGIGVSRVVAAAIEQNYDDKGIIWTPALAPFQIGLINLRAKDEACIEACSRLYAQFQNDGLEVLYDDRDGSAGEKFAEMDLIGLPWQCIVGPKGLENGQAEWKNRQTGETLLLPLGQLPPAIQPLPQAA